MKGHKAGTKAMADLYDSGTIEDDGMDFSPRIPVPDAVLDGPAPQRKSFLSKILERPDVGVEEDEYPDGV